ncbi:hypothetical protein AAFF_G00353970 [Aldrovandia affinis]|uniref:RNase H type-1 domain-containing protein n=1 Tax=Aldrovandia affinis TaxID=143900 RepID=A0AAD7SIX3_9TELE|nr:hypothetical protein AAFF_G00353970 [Aldrovandia affinis]
MSQWQARKFLMAAGKPVKHQQLIARIWDAIQQHDDPVSVVKVRAHVVNPTNVHEHNNNIVDQLAREAARHGNIWDYASSVNGAMSALSPAPLDLKQYQKELWDKDGELIGALRTDSLVTVVDGLVLREGKYVYRAHFKNP